MSNYRQQYLIPYSGSVAVGGPGNTLSDSFDNSRPEFSLIPGAPAVPGFAAVDAKWKRLDIDNVFLRVAAVDTRLQMCLLEGQGKGMCGLYQQLPLAAESETVDLTIYAQSRIAAIYKQPEGGIMTLGPAVGGIFIADDLDADPTTSELFFVGSSANASYADGSGVVGRSATSASFASYNAIPSVIADCQQDFAFQRIRLRQQLDNGLWNITLALEAGLYGSDWLPFGTFTFTGAGNPFKSCGFGVYAGVSPTIAQLQLDNFIVQLEQFGPGYSGVMGGTQTLGAV